VPSELNDIKIVEEEAENIETIKKFVVIAKFKGSKTMAFQRTQAFSFAKWCHAWRACEISHLNRLASVIVILRIPRTYRKPTFTSDDAGKPTILTNGSML
jgi:hypothetical protein